MTKKMTIAPKTWGGLLLSVPSLHFPSTAPWNLPASVIRTAVDLCGEKIRVGGVREAADISERAACIR